MVGASYLKVRYSSKSSSLEGRKIYLNVEPLTRSKGVPTADIPLPTLNPENRILIPTGGNADDFSMDCRLQIESTKVAANISTTGVETDRTDVRSIKDQWDFFFDEMLEVALEGGIFAIYELYLDWNGKTYTGWATGNSGVDNEKYTGEVPIRINFKVGKNPLNFLT